jgi:pimeloyl-ACP methyl ester carboxylesterase
MASQVFLLSGMTPDDRMFDRLLPLLPDAVVIPWAPPRPHESIHQYAERLAATVTPSDSCVFCGVSFGGIVAREIAYLVSARSCILVSSIRHPSELAPEFRWCRCFAGLPLEAILAAIGRAAEVVPRRIRSGSTWRLRKLSGAKGKWHRWATSAVLRWRPRKKLDQVPVIQIHGDADTTFPARYTDPDVLIRGGGHVLAMTHAEEVAAVIRGVMENSAEAGGVETDAGY